jgi:hypothetical protein
MTVHVLQLPLFGLMALAVYYLLGSASGIAATTSQIALGFFLVFYIAFDTLAGIAAGMALDSAVGQSPEYQQGLLHLFEELNFSPIVLAINTLGALGWVVSVVGAAFVARQAGAPRFAIICLLLSTIFAMHPPPTGPLGLAFFLVAAAGIEFSKQSIKTSVPIAAD